jgi:hypothetical protein
MSTTLTLTDSKYGVWTLTYGVYTPTGSGQITGFGGCKVVSYAGGLASCPSSSVAIKYILAEPPIDLAMYWSVKNTTPNLDCPWSANCDDPPDSGGVEWNGGWGSWWVLSSSSCTPFQRNYVTPLPWFQGLNNLWVLGYSQSDTVVITQS